MASVEAINSGELLPSEIHDAIINCHGYVDDAKIHNLAYFAQCVQELLDIAYQRRTEH